MRVTFLGTGTSVGVPILSCRCPVCTSPDPRNRRLRQSVWIEAQGLSVVVDTGSDFREQALRAGIGRLDAVLLTHPHADHIFGLDDTRVFSYRQKAPIPVYGSPSTLEGVRRTFWYAFADLPEGGGRPRLDLRPLDGPLDLQGLPVLPMPGDHGSMPVTVFRFGPFAYATDLKRMPDETVAALRGVETLAINALRYAPEHPTHMTVGEALAAAERIGPRRVFLIHMGHELDHGDLSRSLPAGVEPAWDGLVLDFDGENVRMEVE